MADNDTAAAVDAAVGAVDVVSNAADATVAAANTVVEAADDDAPADATASDAADGAVDVVVNTADATVADNTVADAADDDAPADATVSDAVPTLDAAVNRPLPPGINILKDGTGENIYVINTVVNYYQRKMQVLTQQQVESLPHSKFGRAKLIEAKDLLTALWEWKGLPTTDENKNAIENLGRWRRGNTNTFRLAKDIIEFLQIEDVNLGIQFLTLNCEDIPSSVLESVENQEVYHLFHKSQDDYCQVNELLQQQGEAIESYTQLVCDLQAQMAEGFAALSRKIAATGHYDNTGRAPVDPGSQVPTAVNEPAAAEPAAAEPVAAATPAGGSGGAAIVAAIAAQGNQGTVQPAPLQDLLEPVSDDESESDEDHNYAGEADVSDNDAGEEGERFDSDDDPDGQAINVRYGTPMSSPAGESWAGRVRPSNTPSTHRTEPRHDSRGGGSSEGEGTQAPDTLQFRPVVRRNRRRNTILDDGGEDIPFTAVQKLYDYKLFVTRIAPNADIGRIKEHIRKKLGVNVILKCVSKPSSEFLSFGLFCTTVNNKLDFKMRGIWPENTMIYKWRPRSQNYHRYYQGQESRSPSPPGISNNSRNGRAPHNVGAHLGTNYANVNNSAYTLPRADQRLLHSQHTR